MPQQFDPYQNWFGISASDRPLNHYQLLGIRKFESDLQVIESAVNQRVQFLQDVAAEKPVESQQLLNEVAAARLCLTEAESKKLYDTKLKMGSRSAPAQEKAAPGKTVSSPLPATKAKEHASPIKVAEPEPRRDSNRNDRTSESKKQLPSKSGRGSNVWIYWVGFAGIILVVVVGALTGLAMFGNSKKVVQNDSDIPAANGKALVGKSDPKGGHPGATQKKSKPAKKTPSGKSDSGKTPSKTSKNKSVKDSGSQTKKNGQQKPGKKKTTSKSKTNSGQGKSSPPKTGKKTTGKKTTGKKTSGKKTGNKKTNSNPVKALKPADDPVNKHSERLIPQKGLVVWLNANDSRLKNGPLDEWPNHFQERNGIRAKMPTEQERPFPSKTQPVHVPNAINGLPAVRFDGKDATGAFMVLGDLSGHFKNRQATVFCVLRPEDDRYSFYVTKPVDGAFRHRTQSRVSMFADKSGYLFGSFPESKLYSFAVECHPKSQTVWINGTKKVTKTGIDFDAGTYHRIGSPASFDITSEQWKSYWQRQFFKGDIAEIIVYNQILSAANRTRVENYLYHKWGAGKQHGPPPSGELYGWAQLKNSVATVTGKNGEKVATELKRSEADIYRLTGNAKGSEEWLTLRTPMDWKSLSALKLTIPTETEGKSKSCSILKLETRLVPRGKTWNEGTPIEFSRSDSFIKNLEFALDNKPRPWILPAREHPTEAIFVFKDPVKKVAGKDTDLVIRVRQKDVGKIRFQVTAKPINESMIQLARQNSGADITPYAPNEFGINFGGEAFNDGKIEWMKAKPFHATQSPIGYIGGRKRNFEGPHWRTCHEGVKEIRAVVKNGRYNLRLFFADPTPGARGKRDFSFSVEGLGVPAFDIKSVVEKKFKGQPIPVETKDRKIAVTVTVVNKEYLFIDLLNIEVTDKSLDIVFSKGLGEPVVSALAVQKTGRK